MESILDGIGDGGYVSAVIASNLFVIMYSLLARFWKAESGWHIFFFMLVVALILDHSAVMIIFPKYPGHLWVRAVLYPSLGIIIFWRVLILIRVQILGREMK